MHLISAPQGEKKLGNQRNESQKYAVGQTYREDYGHSQFSGHWDYTITRIEPNGDIFGTYSSGDVFELGIEDVM